MTVWQVYGRDADVLAFNLIAVLYNGNSFHFRLAAKLHWYTAFTTCFATSGWLAVTALGKYGLSAGSHHNDGHHCSYTIH